MCLTYFHRTYSLIKLFLDFKIFMRLKKSLYFVTIKQEICWKKCMKVKQPVTEDKEIIYTKTHVIRQ